MLDDGGSIGLISNKGYSNVVHAWSRTIFLPLLEAEKAVTTVSKGPFIRPKKRKEKLPALWASSLHPQAAPRLQYRTFIHI